MKELLLTVHVNTLVIRFRQCRSINHGRGSRSVPESLGFSAQNAFISAHFLDEDANK